MLIADMIHSCSNAKVAGAAVACIGGLFADRVACAAERKGMDVGDFVSVVVREFACGASHETIGALAHKMSGSDQPILQGLIHVLEPTLDTDALIVDDRDFGFTGPFSAGFGGALAWAH
jgi:hypothetical protein